MSTLTMRAYKRRAHLAVQVEEVEAEKAYANLNIFDLHVLAFALTELLER